MKCVWQQAASICKCMMPIYLRKSKRYREDMRELMGGGKKIDEWRI